MMFQSIYATLILVLWALVIPTLALTEKPVYMSNKYNKPKNCLEFLKLGYRSDGYYLIHTANTVLTVYCDMNSEAGSAWTLIMSYALENIKMSEFRRNPLQSNAPVNEFSPNWSAYRMDLIGMKHLAGVSTHWRATCEFPKYGVDYTDYVRVKFSVFDIMNYLGFGDCKEMEYVDIRGHRCAHCTGGWWERLGTRSPHMASGSTGCQFNAKAGASPGEDNFNLYGSTINKNFRCSSGPKATTNWWFGGYL